MDLGSYVEHDGRPAVRFQRTYDHSIARVWAAVTEPDDRTGTVLAFEPPRYLAFTWGDDELHLHLEPVAEGCRLTLIDVLTERDEAARNGAGWHVCLDELTKRLDGIASDGPHGATTTPWQPTYAAYVAAGLPSGAPIPADVR